METLSLQTPLTKADRVYKMYASRLEKLDIYTLEDFLYHLPFRYDDFSLISQISQVRAGDTVTVQGTVMSMDNVFTKSFKKMQKALVTDNSGTLEIMWFNQPYLTQTIHVNDKISLSGKVDFFGRKLSMMSPEYELLYTLNPDLPSHPDNPYHPTLHTGRLVPIYPETRGVSSKWLRRQVFKLLQEHGDELEEFLPTEVMTKYTYPSRLEALKQVHFPASIDESIKARERLGFDELFLMQLRAQERRQEWEKDLVGNKFQISNFQSQISKFTNSLPFTLTASQSKAVDEIYQDLAKAKPMNRLVQGDVGSGKTIVGAFGAYLAYLNGFQSVLMAPTEILAQQHYETIKRFLEPHGMKVALATGSKKTLKDRHPGEATTSIGSRRNKGKQKDSIVASQPLQNDNRFDILVGTHAVLNEKIKFTNLGLVIIDEQQRFGVEQRSIIREKGNNPHFLTMTATPIPRTVALTMYGDLDISYLSDMPKGRKQIKTWLVPKEKREGAYDWIRKQVKETDSQIFIICPFIEESENMATVKAAAVEFERLKTYVFPDLKLGMLHGKMKAKEKDAVLEEFRNKTFDILVATPVVEVGIDIPNATVIMIEASERFGLAQLHQLRGRVGRGAKQSYCLLFTDATNPQTVTRLKSMESKHNGAELSELDLRLRGPGDIFGTAQSGVPKLKVATFHDFSLIQRSKQEADILFPQLPQYPQLEKKVKEITIAKVSPD